MIIDKDAFEESDFTLMANIEHINYSDDKTLTKVLKKYNILKDIDYLTHSNESNYLLLIHYLEDLFYFKKPIPEDLKLILQENITFKAYIIKHNKRRLDNLFSNGSAIFFKEIITIIKFLSNGEDYTIFINYNEYDYDEISRLFRDYESLLSQLKVSNKDLFEVTFKAYNQLFEAYTLLCIINSIDLQRKQSINKLINLITESINTLKFSVKLNDQELNLINNHLGQLLYYFTHLSYVSTYKKNATYLIDEFHLLFEKQTDGFTLSKNTEFGDEPTLLEKEFIYFKNNSAFLLLLLLEKLAFAYENKVYINTSGLRRCILLFNKNFPYLAIDPEEISLVEFKEKLLNTLVSHYLFSDKSVDKKFTYKTIIDDFIITGDNFNFLNLQTIHDTLLFADTIEDYKYLHIGETLIDSSLIKNDYYEYFKLKTIDIVINYFIKNTTKEDIRPFIQKVYSYIEKNKKASHLLSIFSKLYLSIANWYALSTQEKEILLAKEIYSVFINMNGKEILQKEYKAINEQILTSFGRYYVKDLKLQKSQFEDKDLICLGEKLSFSSLEYQELELKYNINEELTKITNKILYENFIDYENINKKISDLISDKIFYGLSAVYVKGLTKDGTDIIDHGYKHYSLDLKDDYAIEFIFPAVYEEAFSHILNKNKEFIQSHISTVLTSFLKRSQTYIHPVTGLQNKGKLKHDLKSSHQNENIFMEILIGSLSEINLTYGFKVGDKFLASIANKIKSIVSKEDTLYHLGSGRLGVLLAQTSDFNDITNKILNFKIKKNGKDINTKFTIAVTSALNDKLILESENTLNQAILEKKNLLFNT